MTEGILINLSSTRTKKARLALLFKRGGYIGCSVTATAMAILGLYLILLQDNRFGFFALAAALLTGMWVVWYKTELINLSPSRSATAVDDVLDPSLLARLRNPVTPKTTWAALSGNWQEIFITNRLLVDPAYIQDMLSDSEADMETVWQLASKLQTAHESPTLDVGAVTTALILSSPQLVQYLTTKSLKPEDALQCYDWLNRVISYQNAPKPYFGGIGRDWAFGFTPMLERFSTNISLQVQRGGGHFHFMSRSNIIDTLLHNLDQNGSVAIVGDAGIGKTSAVHALAQRLLQDKAIGSLKDHQVVSLNASLILSNAKQQLEGVMLTLFGEAVRSGNMVLFLDDAQLFFQEGTGAFDMSSILLPILQNKRLKLITAFTSTDFQRLKARNPSLAAALAPVVMTEPPEQETFKILEDSALQLEYRTKKIVTFEAVREAYRLSGQYVQDMAYPGRAIRLLEQAAPYTDHNVITARSVQDAVEKTLGVKAGKAEAQEADALLRLEDKIHERMINQTEAVAAVASALRRARAGVGSTKRPIGSFLFLGPTGVGKTELARSLAATYYGDEKSIIRLDMSEYQQASDLSRLLEDGSDSHSLILAIRKQPFSVVLLDEIEKAHSSVLNLLLQLLDEGQITDTNGKPASFRNAIIIVTSNAGSQDILKRIAANQSLKEFERPLIDKLIQEGIFRAELVNRFDEIALFRPLNQQELSQVARLMLGGINQSLSEKNIQVEVTDQALAELTRRGYDPQFGARPLRRVIQRNVEDIVATKILRGEANPGAKILLDVHDLQPQDTTPANNTLTQE